MSMQCFLATAKPLQKTNYKYKYILPTIANDDMFYDDGIFFDCNLTNQEKLATGNIFRDFCCYAVRSGFKLDYEPRFRQVISENYAINALEELKWFRSFIKKKLLQQGVCMVINLWLGKDINSKNIRTVPININSWELSLDKSWEFEYGIVYNFMNYS